MIRKLLVANRGEIAIRVIRAARELGIRTVAVASDADAHALHASLADECVLIGDPSPAASYLNIARVLSAAHTTGADAIHPGYGFLSERAEFSEACARAGINFVGPSPEAMRKLGAKIDAKRLAVEAGVPITPGYFEPGATPSAAKTAASEIGYPVMLKASAGGGGRGMRIVREADSFDEQWRLASEEAEKAFGDGAMMVEKLIERPRHIEVQVLADQHGNVACLFERECSLQRRHQKVLEEAPASNMDEETWAAMQEAARKLVQASGYSSAGTVEFMVDQASGAFYFLEVNARLQVEHPVTEAITGVDIVQWQLRIAGGERLDLPEALMKGDRSAIRGHAIEARIVAEDPERGFLPSVGPILAWAEPRGPGIRFDTGYGPGAEVSRFYDSLLAKAIVHSDNRAAALARLESTLLDTHILGVRTNISFLLDLLKHGSVRVGEMDTGLIEREFTEWRQSNELPPELGDIMATARHEASRGTGAKQEVSPAWALPDAFRNAKA